MDHDSVAALVDPFGLSALSITTKYWTAAERNTLLPPLAGLLLANRLLWLAVAAVLFALAWRTFRFAVRGRSAGAAPATAAQGAAPGASPPEEIRLPVPRADAATGRAHSLALARFDMTFVFRSPAFFVLLLIGVVNAGAATWFAGEYYGSFPYPATRVMVQALLGASHLIPIGNDRRSTTPASWCGGIARRAADQIHRRAGGIPTWTAPARPRFSPSYWSLGATSLGWRLAPSIGGAGGQGISASRPVSYLLWFFGCLP